MLYNSNSKSMGIAYVLWLFLDGLGGHRFYNGNTGSAVAQLLMTIFGWLLLMVAGVGMFLLISVGIWVLVDAFLITGWIRSHNNALVFQLGA